MSIDNITASKSLTGKGASEAYRLWKALSEDISESEKYRNDKNLEEISHACESFLGKSFSLIASERKINRSKLNDFANDFWYELFSWKHLYLIWKDMYDLRVNFISNFVAPIKAVFPASENRFKVFCKLLQDSCGYTSGEIKMLRFVSEIESLEDCVLFIYGCIVQLYRNTDRWKNSKIYQVVEEVILKKWKRVFDDFWESEEIPFKTHIIDKFNIGMLCWRREEIGLNLLINATIADFITNYAVKVQPNISVLKANGIISEYIDLDSILYDETTSN